MQFHSLSPRRQTGPAGMRVVVELSPRGEKMLCILNDLFDGCERAAATSADVEPDVTYSATRITNAQ